MSSAYHPETDGSSERSNKTINQAIRFYVEDNQHGWVAALPKIRFDMMNSTNASTGLNMFELRFGRTPRILPPLVPLKDSRKLDPCREMADAHKLVADIQELERVAKDNLALAKVHQAFQADKTRGPCEIFEEGDWVMLSTWSRRNNYKNNGSERRVAKFFPRYDGPYRVTRAFPETSSYQIDMPNHPNKFPTFYVERLKRYVANDDDLFPSRKVTIPEPVIVDGFEEWEIEKILRAKRKGRGWQFLVSYVDQPESENRWLPYRLIHDCSAVDKWIEEGGDGPPQMFTDEY